MRVLMLSLDRGFWGSLASGDVVTRHQSYADLAGSLDVIVFAPPDHEQKQLSSNLRIFPTKSGAFSHYRKAVELGRRLAQTNQYDLLVTQEFAAPAGAKLKNLLGLPWLVNIHSMFFSSEWLKLNPVKWYLWFLIRKAIKTADGFRVNNEIIKNQLGVWGIKVPVLVQHTPVAVEKFLNVQKPVNKTIKILYVGRLSLEKNVAMLIRAVRSLANDLELLIIGAGPEEESLKRLAQGDQRIRFQGAKLHEELIDLYRDADIFVLSSNTESFGKVLIEAGAAGCAIIATRTAGAVSILGDSAAGVLVKVGDQTALTEALAKLIAHENLREKLGENARRLAVKYDAKSATIKTVEFWRKIAKP